MRFLNSFANYANGLEFTRSLVVLVRGASKTTIMIILDAVFFLLAITAKSLAERYMQAGNAANVVSLINAALISLAYYALILLLYSLFKLSILGLIKSSVEKSKFSISRTGRFYLLNLLLGAVIGGLYFLIALILTGIKERFAFVTMIILAAYVFLAYIFWNMSHSFFAANQSVKNSLAKGLESVKNRRVYSGVIIPSSLLAIILYLPYSVAYLKGGILLNQILLRAFEIILYCIFAVNRAGFYLIARETKR